MKKRIFWWAAILLLLALLVAPRYVRFPQDAAVTFSAGGKNIPLSAEDSAEVIKRINRYHFWEGEDSYYCDCISEFAVTIGEDHFLYAIGHFHWDERELTLYLEEEDERAMEWMAERYLERNR